MTFNNSIPSSSRRTQSYPSPHQGHPRPTLHRDDPSYHHGSSHLQHHLQPGSSNNQPQISPLYYHGTAREDARGGARYQESFLNANSSGASSSSVSYSTNPCQQPFHHPIAQPAVPLPLSAARQPLHLLTQSATVSSSQNVRSPIISPLNPLAQTTRPTVVRASHALPHSGGNPGRLGDEPEDSDDGEQPEDKQKLEVKREKNRVKQRNLRARRANHISDLEQSLQSLQNDHTTLQSAFAEVNQKEVRLNEYIAALEQALTRSGQAGEVHRLRSMMQEKGSVLTEDKGIMDVAGMGGRGYDEKHHLAAVDIDVPEGRKRRRLLSEEVINAGEMPGLSFTNTTVAYDTAPSPSRSLRIEDLLSPSLDYVKIIPHAEKVDPQSTRFVSPTIVSKGHLTFTAESDSNKGLGLFDPALGSSLLPPGIFSGLDHVSGINFDILSATLGPAGAAALLGYHPSHHNASPSLAAWFDNNPALFTVPHHEDAAGAGPGSSHEQVTGKGTGGSGDSAIYNPFVPQYVIDEEGNVAIQSLPMLRMESGESGGSGSGRGDVEAVENLVDKKRGRIVSSSSSPSGLALKSPLALPSSTKPNQVHPSLITARVLLRALLANQSHLPVSHCILPPLTPQHQIIILNAIYNLTTPEFRDDVNASQVRNLPPLYLKILMTYSTDPKADARIILMPIAILRGRIIEFLEEGLPFDVSAFITHVLADARIFGDTADPDAWEMSDEFWDVWGGWFKNGRRFCKSLSGWRRRKGNQGAAVLEILLGAEGEQARMTELIGRPPGWKMTEAQPPSVVVDVSIQG